MRKNPFVAQLPRLKPALVPTASVINLPIQVELFHQVERGPLDLTESR